MDRTDKAEKDRRGQGRIPVRFVDDEERGKTNEPGVEDSRASSPDEAGRVTSGEVEAEAGGATSSEAPADAQRVAAEPDASSPRAEATDKAGPDEESQRKPDPSAGPIMAELLATRAELRRVEGELKRAADERAELAEKMARRQADYDNFRKRTERERAEVYGRALGDVVGHLFPVLDNLQRALEAERSVQTGESEEFRHFVRGIELISKQLGGALESMGVEAIPTVGERFDPHVHEAVATEETDQFAPDTVMQEMQRGYRLGDKLLRPAMVKVAK